MAFEIHTHDTSFIIDHFLDSISHLEIFVSGYDQVKPTVVLALIQALPMLRRMEIWLQMGCAESGQIGSNATCLATNFDTLRILSVLAGLDIDTLIHLPHHPFPPSDSHLSSRQDWQQCPFVLPFFLGGLYSSSSSSLW